MDDDVPGSHRLAVAVRRLAQAGMGAPGLDAERALAGVGLHDHPPTHLLDIDWMRLVHKSALDQHVDVEETLHANQNSFVARARRKVDGRRVALKILSPSLWEDDELRERFRREGEVLLGLDHPNLARLVDRGIYGYARWLMIEWVEGQDLGAAIEHEPLDVPTVIEHGIALCAGLAELHRRGLIHRDVKPDNLLWDPAAKRLVLTDFGIAKLRRRREGELTLTATGDVMGTVGYMAPECAHGSKYVDHRVDVYSAGLVVYELATRERGPKELGQPWQPQAFDPRLDAIVARATAMDPAHRYPSADAMRADLERVRPRGWIARVFRRR